MDRTCETCRRPIEREIGYYSFEDGGYIRIIAGGGVETIDAINMADTLLALKRKELDERHGTGKGGEDAD